MPKSKLLKASKSKPLKASVKDLKNLGKKYDLSPYGSRKDMARLISHTRASYLGQKERKILLPFLNQNDKKFMKDLIASKKRQAY
jgi:hypothetical protein